MVQHVMCEKVIFHVLDSIGPTNVTVICPQQLKIDVCSIIYMEMEMQMIQVYFMLSMYSSINIFGPCILLLNLYVATVEHVEPNLLVLTLDNWITTKVVVESGCLPGYYGPWLALKQHTQLVLVMIEICHPHLQFSYRGCRFSPNPS